MLMRPNKVETAVQYSVCCMEVLAGFSSHGNSINIIPFLYSNVIYVYIYIYIYIYIMGVTVVQQNDIS